MKAICLTEASILAGRARLVIVSKRASEGRAR
jgi:hypothetical protein